MNIVFTCRIFCDDQSKNLVKTSYVPMPCWDEKRWWGRPRVWGRPSLKRLASSGAVVHGLSRDEATLSAAMQDLPGSGHRATAVDFDHSEALGNVVGDACYDILIHNTGGPAAGPLADADPDDLDAAFRRHVRSAHVLMQQVLPGMRAQGYGRIVLVVSTSVITPIQGLGVSTPFATPSPTGPELWRSSWLGMASRSIACCLDSPIPTA